MERKNNYAIQAQNAKKIFLSYDQNALAEKLGLRQMIDTFTQPFWDSPTALPGKPGIWSGWKTVPGSMPTALTRCLPCLIWSATAARTGILPGFGKT